jgi:hypothetical protein
VAIIVPPAQEYQQGDLFDRVPWGFIRNLDFVRDTGKDFVRIPAPASGWTGRLVSTGGLSLGMALTHECVHDKRDGYPLAFAPLLQVASQRERIQEQIRANRQYATFWVPATDGVCDESYVDFRFISVIARKHLDTMERRASLDDEWRDALREQLFRFWSRPPEADETRQ